RYDLNADIRGAISKKFKFTVSLNANMADQIKIPDKGQWNGGVVGTAITLPGFIGKRNEDGSYPSFQGLGYNTSAVINPMIFINEYDNKRVRKRIIGNTSLSYNIVKGLQLKTHLGFDALQWNENDYMNSYDGDVPSIP